MTHDELLSRINEDERVAHLYGYSGHQRLLKYFNSLRAVVELHKPKQFEVSPDEYKTICSVCPDVWVGGEYPCPTIQVIERELA